MSSFPVKLVVSDRMTQRGGEEHSLVRLAQRARDYFNFGKDQLILRNGATKLTLTIKQTYKEDMQSIPRGDRARTGFVTEENYRKLMSGKRKEDFWLTDEGEPIMIGCDPEFVLEDDSGNMVRAAIALSGAGHKFGSDGNPAELRPDPSQNADKVVENIRDLLENAPREAKPYRWIAGAYVHECSLGGHIHIGTPEALHVNSTLGADDPNLKLHKSLAMLLDDCMTAPMVKIDRPDAISRRQGGRFGRYADARYDYGRLEWRTPSGFWLVHPDIARAVLGTSKAVAECFWNRLPDKDRDKILNTDEETAHNKGILSKFGIRTAGKTREIIYNNKISKPEFDKSLARLKGLETYGEYRSYVDQFEDVVTMSEADLERIGLDIKANWL